MICVFLFGVPLPVKGLSAGVNDQSGNVIENCAEFESPEYDIDELKIHRNDDLERVVSKIIEYFDGPHLASYSKLSRPCQEVVYNQIESVIRDNYPEIRKSKAYKAFVSFDATSGEWILGFLTRAVIERAGGSDQGIREVLRGEVNQALRVERDLDIEAVPENSNCSGSMKYIQDDIILLPRSSEPRGVRIFRCDPSGEKWYFLKEFGWLYPVEK